MIKHKKVYRIETLKNANCRYSHSPNLDMMYLRRITATRYPCYYGCIEELETTSTFKKIPNKKDFFLITDKEPIVPNLLIAEELVNQIGTFHCIDTLSKENDDKIVVGLKDELINHPKHRIITELDQIAIFLSTLRGSFKITGFTAGTHCPTLIKEYYESLDFSNLSLFPNNKRIDLEKDYPHQLKSRL